MKQPTSDWKLRFKAWLGKTWHAFGRVLSIYGIVFS